MRKHLPYISILLTLPISELSFGNNFSEDFVTAAIQRTNHLVMYDGSYYAIPYPNGDVPTNVGVCTDVVIRSYRSIGTDLQQLVHEDLSSNFEKYPSRKIWGLSSPDTNIDHRRVPNLQTFFERNGQVLEISSEAGDYKPGDLVTWMLPGNLPHIGIVTDRIDSSSGNPLIAHNVGRGPELQDTLYKYEISGHYRYVPESYKK